MSHGAHRLRTVWKGGGGLDAYNDVGVFVTDIPRKDLPLATGEEKPKLPEPFPPPAKAGPEPWVVDANNKPVPGEHMAAAVSTMKETLKAGVQVVSADQLFPTPPEFCERMVALAGLREGERVLEPSAGTGNIIKAIRARGGRVTAIEVNPSLARMAGAHCADFLVVEPDKLIAPRLGEEDQRDPEPMPGIFDAVIMNPPFKDGSDIKHILHAREFLKPGGRLVAICANGPRQNEKLRPIVDTWEDLPEGTFAGTGVRAVLLTWRKP